VLAGGFIATIIDRSPILIVSVQPGSWLHL
jgi:hypothetical protein